MLWVTLWTVHCNKVRDMCNCSTGNWLLFYLVSDHMLPTFLQPPSRTCSRSIDTRTFHSTLTSALTCKDDYSRPGIHEIPVSLLILVHQLENIFLEVYKDSFNSVSNCEATVRQTMQEYNEKAEKIGIKLFCISSKIHFSNDSTKFFTIMLQREVRTNVNSQVLMLFLVSL